MSNFTPFLENWRVLLRRWPGDSVSSGCGKYGPAFGDAILVRKSYGLQGLARWVYDGS